MEYDLIKIGELLIDNKLISAFTFTIVLIQFTIWVKNSLTIKKALKLEVTSLSNKKITFIQDLQKKIKNSDSSLISPTLQFNSSTESKRITNYFNIIESKASLLIQLGLLGTFLGITTMVFFLAVLDKSSNASLIPMISSSSIAFLSSLFGIFFSILLRKGITKLINEYENVKQDVINSLNFNYAQIASRSLKESNQELANEMANKFNSVVVGLMSSVDRYASKIENNTNKLTDIFSKMVVDLNKTIEDSFKKLDQSVLKKLEKSISDFDGIVNKYRINSIDLSTKITEELDNIIELYTSSKELLTNYNLTLITFIDTLETSNTRLIENKGLTVELSESILNAIDNQKNLSKELNTYTENLTTSANDYSNISQQILGKYEDINKVVEDINNNFIKIIPPIEQSIKKLNELPQQLENVFTYETKTELNNTVKQFAKHITQIDALLKGISNMMNERLEDIQTHFKYLFTPKTINDAMIKYQGDLSQLAKDIQLIASNSNGKNGRSIINEEESQNEQL